VDTIDRKLLHALAGDGRRTYAELAADVGLSGPSTAERVRRLEEAGAITGYAALIDPASLGLDLTAFVAVSLGHPRFRSGFLEAVWDLEGILECHHTAGDEDYLLKVRCRGTGGLEALVSEGIKQVPGVARTRTTVVLSTPMERPFVPEVG
jgi:Lrp/AsnC family leucine-responsive transcriptional regulator